jgi:hypothetical protein
MLAHDITTYDVKMEEGGHPSTVWVKMEANLNVHVKLKRRFREEYSRALGELFEFY